MNSMKTIEELEYEMGLNGVVDIQKPDIKFEKAYFTMVSNPAFNCYEVRLWLYLRLNNTETNYGAFPSTKKISKETGMSASTIQRTIKELEKKEAILTLQRFKREDRKQLQNLVMFNSFNEHEGKFDNGEVWKYIKDKYKTKMVWIDIKKVEDKTLYMPIPIEESELTVNAKGVKTLK